MDNSEQRKASPLAEHARLADSSADMPGSWKAIGPYLSERAWGTVREDYSADGKPWRYFPYEHARSRAYRWNEDGVCTENLNPNVLTMKSARYGARIYDAGSLNLARDRRRS